MENPHLSLRDRIAVELYVSHDNEFVPLRTRLFGHI